MLILITGNSGSGKSSVGEVLNERGWKSLYNYTTRPPRNEKEKDTYIFLTDKQYDIKLANGDFIEHMSYNGNKYALGRFMEKDTYYYAIVNPDGREQLLSIANHSFFIDVDKDVQYTRLINRGDRKEDIEKRLKDEFKPTSSCIIIDGLLHPNKVADIIEHSLNIKSIYEG